MLATFCAKPARIGRAGGFANDQFGMDGNNIRESGLAADALKEDTRRDSTHLRKRLADGGEAWVVESGALNIVEADNGNVAGDLKAVIDAGTNGSDGGDVVVADDGGEIESALKEFVRRLVSKLRSGDLELQLHGVLGSDGQLEVAGDGHEAVPAIVGVGTVAASAHEGDLAMTKLIEVTKREFGGATLIEDDVGYTFDFAMASNSDDGQSEAAFENGVDENESFDGPVHEETGILIDEVRFAAVAGGEIEVAFLKKEFLNAGENVGGVVVTEFGHKDANGKRLLLAKRSRIETWPVVELSGRLGDTIAGFLRDGANARRIIEDERNCGRREIQVFAEGAEADRLARLLIWSLL